MAVIAVCLDRLGLALNETKTHIVDAKREGFNFLGFYNQDERELEDG